MRTASTIAPIAAAMLLAACSSTTTGAPAPSASSPATVPTSALPTSASPAPSSPVAAATSFSPNSSASASAASASASRCHTSELSLSQKDAGAAAGNEGIIVILTNKASTTCAVDGYPGIGLLDASGRLLATTVTRGSSMLGQDKGSHPVTLAPGAAASATVGFDVGPTGCDNVTSFQVTPPDETVALKVSIASPGIYDGTYRYMCAPAVTALVAGTTGSPAA